MDLLILVQDYMLVHILAPVSLGLNKALDLRYIEVMKIKRGVLLLEDCCSL